LERETARAISQEGADPLNQIWADPLPAEEGEERRGFHVIEATLHVKEEGGDLIAEAVEGLNIVL